VQSVDEVLRHCSALIDTFHDPAPGATIRVALAPCGVHVDELALFDELAALAAGHEGVMAKDPRSPYEPGGRGKRWFKVKAAETVDCVIIAADRGSGRRVGWLSNYHLAVRDGERFADVGKTFKGLTDAEFRAMTERLRALAFDDDGYTVRVRPEVVVEVEYNEIQRSPTYPSGLALRFARIARIRDDKAPGQATTLDELRALYERQFATKGRADRDESRATREGRAPQREGPVDREAPAPDRAEGEAE
jgi:hypothetical protein